ncbi:Uncharacterised protein [Enterobacter hormaechei]|nr:Uncharacterised protein [Enterobacter hormaechei]
MLFVRHRYNGTTKILNTFQTIDSGLQTYRVYMERDHQSVGDLFFKDGGIYHEWSADLSDRVTYDRQQLKDWFNGK